jgi:hypothetical protein
MSDELATAAAIASHHPCTPQEAGWLPGTGTPHLGTRSFCCSIGCFSNSPRTSSSARRAVQAPTGRHVSPSAAELLHEMVQVLCSNACFSGSALRRAPAPGGGTTRVTNHDGGGEGGRW